MGVKSLWTLLAPVGRPVMLETTEGKSMAIDSSIWIYQFQATMRDKEGRALNNAHVLGFLRRISKLLFYGIKPVFVFDGGAPTLKRNTLNERRKKKSGAAASHYKLAEKLLAAQMRREALNHTKYIRDTYLSNFPKAKQPREVELNDDTVYLEDIDGSAPRTPAKRKAPPPSSTSAKKSASAKKATFRDLDPYNLPEFNMDEAISKATRSAAPDPRLATEDELRTFIEDMRPGDFDIYSPAFRELPTEVQYEIIGDLRLKSRQTSYDRLHKMLKNARTPMDFSKQQILNLKQRNTLTQQLLMTTDSIGNAHIAIPVRIASERNREYILMKNEGEEGGWVLGIKDIGTREKPIVLDHEEPEPEIDDESDEDMEEVEVPTLAAPDPDLRDYQREMALSAISKRHTDKGLLPARTINRKGKSTALADALQIDATAFPISRHVDPGSDDDDLVAYAVQASLDQHSMPQASSMSTPDKDAESSQHASSREGSSDDDFYVDFIPPTRLQSALSLANASPKVIHATSSQDTYRFGKPSLLISPNTQTVPEGSGEEMEQVDSFLPVEPEFNDQISTQPSHTINISKDTPSQTPESSPLSNHGLAFIPTGLLLQQPSTPPAELPPNDQGLISSESDEDMEEVPLRAQQQQTPRPKTRGSFFTFSGSLLQQSSEPPVAATRVALSSESDEDMEDVPVEIQSPPEQSHPNVHGIKITPSGSLLQQPSTLPEKVAQAMLDSDEDEDIEVVPDVQIPQGKASEHIVPIAQTPLSVSSGPITDDVPTPVHTPEPPPPVGPAVGLVSSTFPDDSMDEPLFTWSRSPSPSNIPDLPPGNAEDWDAAQEMDPHVEEGEFAHFMSQVKGRNVEDVRKEIDEEIKSLNQQRKAAIRDSEDITQQMISQIMTMLRLFGIPYITAPMEAEAQCAELVSLRLVDGVITDDSDVFLFGAERVYKNMFNQSKTVECFLTTDLSRELGLDRDTLIQLAYLLGSDYTEGLPGVGPVVAMELLREFPGRDGLFKFRNWWVKVQSGRDREEDNKSKFRKQFKKKFKKLYLPNDWPNSVVRDAYYHPAVDSSEEPFKWGMPDLDGLREFFQVELGWRQSKVDELLLPIIQKMNKRSQVAAMNKQGTLNNFLDLSAGSGSHAPRQRHAYASNRLQQVISDFRNRQKSGSVTPRSKPTSDAEEQRDGSNSDAGPPAKKRKKKVSTPTDKGAKGKAKAGTNASSTKSRSRGGKTRKRKGKGKEQSTSDEDASADEIDQPTRATVEDPQDSLRRTTELNLRPRPKPRPRYKNAINAEETNDGAGSDDNSTSIHAP
ncbi:hypothetical protein HYPSUDRAFT_159469 [Hypholoma sublateritium FD-334 SS-4]|uniref:PIN domain-like protein n=1 Tax=Hypholoma sublateritium (strain FD-334 SS-4) TaxID=945553 RepID=A0A0D2MQX6_HYPSF|nr:hypothetical protein HYPSUDRAFT_159469 [Hypholoma sublateritium FD-334 SS-4]